MGVELVDHGSEFVGGGTKRRLSATFRRATGGFIADCDARVVSEASDTPTHKESNTRRLALGRLSRLEASGHQAEQFSIGVSTGEQQSDAPGIAQDDGADA